MYIYIYIYIYICTYPYRVHHVLCFRDTGQEVEEDLASRWDAGFGGGGGSARKPI